MATAELKARIEADASQFIKEVNRTKALMASFPQRSTFGFTSGDVDKVSESTRKFAASLEQARGNMGGLSEMARRFGPLLSVTAIMAAGRAVLKFADDISEGASRLGVATTAFQQWQQAAITSGGSMEQVEAMALRMQRALGGDMTEKQERAFARLGLSIAELQAMDPAASFEAVVNAISLLPSQIDRSAVAMEIFGRGAKGVQDFANALADAKKHMTALVSDEDIQRVAKMNDGLDSMWLKLKRMGVSTAAGLFEFATLKKGAGTDAFVNRKIAEQGAAPTAAERAAFSANVRANQSTPAKPIETEANRIKREATEKKAAEQANRDREAMAKLRADAAREQKAADMERVAAIDSRRREVELARAEGRAPAAELPFVSGVSTGARRAAAMNPELLRAAGGGDLGKGIEAIKATQDAWATVDKQIAEQAAKERAHNDKIATIKAEQWKRDIDEAQKLADAAQQAADNIFRQTVGLRRGLGPNIDGAAAAAQDAAIDARERARSIAAERSPELAKAMLDRDIVEKNQRDAMQAGMRAQVAADKAGNRLMSFQQRNAALGAGLVDSILVTNAGNRLNRRQIRDDQTLAEKVARVQAGEVVRFSPKEQARLREIRQDEARLKAQKQFADKQALAAQLAGMAMAADMAKAVGILNAINANIVKITARAA